MSNDYYLLLSRSAVFLRVRHCLNFASFLVRNAVEGGPVRPFPNGAIEIDCREIPPAELDEGLAGDGSPELAIDGASIFRPIAPFDANRRYYIQYPGTYQKKVGPERSFSVGPHWAIPPAPGESELARLEVTVGFRKRISNPTARKLAAAVAGWGAAAAQAGAFGEGPARLASEGVEFSGPRARFFLDVSQSGQNTLNWLALHLLDFGEDVQTITDVFFGADPGHIDGFLGRVRGEWTLADYAGTTPPPGARAAKDDGRGHVPREAKRFRSYRSDQFPILRMPSLVWETFALTVYFGRPLADAEKDQWGLLVRSWAALASYGGFGGTGIPFCDDPAFDDATDSATVHADMGDAEPRIALSVFIRVLEAFAAAHAPVDALVLGLPGPEHTEI